jgi:hypothetical protein
VAPIALSRDPGIRFWISVSGTPAEDNKHYWLREFVPLDESQPDDPELHLLTEIELRSDSESSK